MSDQNCTIEGCSNKVYSPVGTKSACKEHFVDFVNWRRRKGGKPMFRKYSAMTMEERDILVDEWSKSITVAS